MNFKQTIAILACLWVAATSHAAEQNFLPAQGQQPNLIISQSQRGSSAMYYRLYVDEQYIGKFKRGSEYALRLPVGEHRVMVNDEERSEIIVEIVGGELLQLRGNYQTSPRRYIRWSLPEGSSLAGR